jgi:hypothetical protein
MAGRGWLLLVPFWSSVMGIGCANRKGEVVNARSKGLCSLLVTYGFDFTALWQ